MKNNKLRALRTLANIRLRRQDQLDRQRASEQATLASLVLAAMEKEDAVTVARQEVVDQIARIAELLRSGSRFQVADYLGQQDYQAWLEGKAVAAQAEKERADHAVTQQQEVLQQARAAAGRNLERRKRLDDSIRQIGIDADVAQMDSDDEEAEEATVTRRKLEARRAAVDAVDGASGHDSATIAFPLVVKEANITLHGHD